MIQDLREKLSGVVAIGLVVLIAIPLAFIGIESIFLNSTRVNSVATVNGEPISELELDRAVVNQQNQILSVLGQNADPSLLEDANIRPGALNSLIDQRLLFTQANHSNMGVSEEYVGSQILAAPDFQLNGQFSETLYRNYLTQLGYTNATFIAAMQQDMVTNQLVGGLRATVPVAQSEIAQIAKTALQTRDYEYITIPSGQVAETVQVSEQEISVYYETSQDEFLAPDRVTLDYIEVSAADLAEYVEVDAQAVYQRFEALQAAQPTMREVAHILLESGQEEIAATLETRLANGESFDELAAEFSVDIGSANSGGYLGFTSGDSFPGAFENALLALDIGQVSEPVTTDAGIHLIKLLSIEEPEPLVLDDQYAIIEAELQQESSLDLFTQVSDEVKDQTYTTDSLAEVIDQVGGDYGLRIQTTPTFTRDLGDGIATDARVRSVAFNDGVLNQGYIETIELTEDRWVFIALNQFQPSAIQPLEEVRDQIVATLTREKTLEVLAEQAGSLANRLTEGSQIDELANEYSYEWQAAFAAQRSTPSEINQLAFSTPAGGALPFIGSSPMRNGDYLVYKITNIVDGDYGSASALETSQLYQQALSTRTEIEWVAYVASLREEGDIDLKIDLPGVRSN